MSSWKRRTVVGRESGGGAKQPRLEEEADPSRPDGHGDEAAEPGALLTPNSLGQTNTSPTAKESQKSDSVSKSDENIDGHSERDALNDVDDDVSSGSSKRLPGSFYEKSCEDLAKALLGQVLVRMHNGERTAGRIVETESYLGRIDKAAHSYKGKTDRNTAMFMLPGTAYVYNIYGMYCCMNISSQGEGAAVLLRALQPLEGDEKMQALRLSNRKKGSSSAGKPLKQRELCNGPSKLTQALSIDKASCNKIDLTTSDLLWLEQAECVEPSNIVTCKRINIAYAEEWSDKPLRFYEKGNVCVSIRDKEAEKQLAS